MNEMMLQALYDALYVSFRRFQWVTFTPHEVIGGQMSRDMNKFELEEQRKRERNERRNQTRTAVS